MRRTIVIAVFAGAILVSPAVAAAPAPRATKAPWSRPADPMALVRRAGLTPRTHEFFAYHVHAHLDVFVDARRVLVPAGIGIKISDPAVSVFRGSDGSIGYGGISPPCTHPCISPLHTHDATGILHTESEKSNPNRLGELFTEWAVRLTPSCVGGYCRKIKFYVGGKRYTGDPRAIQLTNLKEIAIVIGRPPASIPSTFPR